MSDWPAGLTVAPIGEWPGVLTPERQRTRSPFSASWSDTLGLLRRELAHLLAKDAELLVAVRPEDFRLDGRPRANAKQEHPGVILSFDSSVGHLSYPCDTFSTWQANLRAVALSLESLRRVDRYGVTKRGEQYRGFLAIEAPASAPTAFESADAAKSWIYSLIEPHFIAGGMLDVPAAVRRAKRIAHPDIVGGDAQVFARVMQAEAVLRGEGVL
ncbi:hypothetical protein ACEYYH_10620 [Microbacterium trichothecenolyticum]|uniref:hypothetical protein n=1 Tax=Microbacterium trichothecenolyticum TaxID=69370 RepID=UPI0035BE3190